MNLPGPIWISHVWNFGTPYRSGISICCSTQFRKSIYLKFDFLPFTLLKTDLQISKLVQCCSIENHQSPVYAVNLHFSWHSNRCLNCCCNLALLTHICHIWELSNEVLHSMTLYLTGCQKHDKSKSKVLLLLSRFNRFNFDLSYFWYFFR